MARPVTTLVIFFVCFNIWGNILVHSGMAEQMGVSAEVGGDELINQQAEKDIPSTSGIGETLFGLYNMLVGFINGVFNLATVGLTMLETAGVPTFYTTQLERLFGILIIIDLVSFYKGWGL